MTTIRILLANAQTMLRQGLQALLDDQPSMLVVGEAADNATALAEIGNLAPDIAIVDLELPPHGAVELASQLQEAGLPTRLIVLTANPGYVYLQQCLKLGVQGYLLTHSPASELFATIHSVAAGGRHFDQSVVNDLAVNLATNFGDLPAVAGGTLSEREQAVLRLIAQGHSNKEIAAQLDISAKTVETYKTRSLRKLGLRGRADIVRFAVERGWLK